MIGLCIQICKEEARKLKVQWKPKEAACEENSEQLKRPAAGAQLTHLNSCCFLLAAPLTSAVATLYTLSFRDSYSKSRLLLLRDNLKFLHLNTLHLNCVIYYYLETNKVPNHWPLFGGLEECRQASLWKMFLSLWAVCLTLGLGMNDLQSPLSIANQPAGPLVASLLLNVCRFGLGRARSLFVNSRFAL